MIKYQERNDCCEDHLMSEDDEYDEILENIEDTRVKLANLINRAKEIYPRASKGYMKTAADYNAKCITEIFKL